MPRACHGLQPSDYGVDSSSRFPFRVRTTKQTMHLSQRSQRTNVDAVFVVVFQVLEKVHITQ